MLSMCLWFIHFSDAYHSIAFLFHSIHGSTLLTMKIQVIFRFFVMLTNAAAYNLALVAYARVFSRVSHYSYCCCNKLPQIQLSSGLTQHKLLTLWYWVSEVWNKPHWAKIKVSAGLHSLLGGSRGESVFLHFLASRYFHVSWFIALSIFKASNNWSRIFYNAISLWFWLFCLPLPLLRTFVIIGPPCII